MAVLIELTLVGFVSLTFICGFLHLWHYAGNEDNLSEFYLNMATKSFIISGIILIFSIFYHIIQSL